MSPTKKRTIVKLEESLFEVKEDGEKVVNKRFSDEDLFTESVLGDGVQAMLQNDVNRLTNQAYEELKSTFKASLKATVLKTLGFEQDRYGTSGWSVDHCNGRNSEISGHLSRKVKDLFESEVDPLIEKMMPEMIKDVATSIRSEFKSNFLREVKFQARAASENAAKDFLKQLLTEEVQGLKKQAIEQVQIAMLGRPLITTPAPLDDDDLNIL